MQALEPSIPEKSRPIKAWAVDDRPREKLIIKGPEALSDSELICILVGKGAPGQSAVDLARNLLHKCDDNLQTLARLSVSDMLQLDVDGLGKAKSCTIAAALELGRRRAAGFTPEKPVFKDPKAAAEYLKHLFGDHTQETFTILYLDQSNGLRSRDTISKGGFAATYVDPRIIFKKALQYEAASFIVCHNHPSGSLRPSRADELLTARIKEGSKYLDIKFVDHIIVTSGGYFSFATEGLL